MTWIGLLFAESQRQCRREARLPVRTCAFPQHSRSMRPCLPLQEDHHTFFLHLRKLHVSTKSAIRRNDMRRSSSRVWNRESDTRITGTRSDTIVSFLRRVYVVMIPDLCPGECLLSRLRLVTSRFALLTRNIHTLQRHLLEPAMSILNALLKPKMLVPLAGNVVAITSATYYLQSKLNYNLEEQEARLDEIEGTLRGHIGLIEDALDRIEKKPNQNHQEKLYSQRARDRNKGGDDE